MTNSLHFASPCSVKSNVEILIFSFRHKYAAILVSAQSSGSPCSQYNSVNSNTGTLIFSCTQFSPLDTSMLPYRCLLSLLALHVLSIIVSIAIQVHSFFSCTQFSPLDTSMLPYWCLLSLLAFHVLSMIVSIAIQVHSFFPVPNFLL